MHVAALKYTWECSPWARWLGSPTPHTDLNIIFQTRVTREFTQHPSSVILQSNMLGYWWRVDVNCVEHIEILSAVIFLLSRILCLGLGSQNELGLWTHLQCACNNVEGSMSALKTWFMTLLQKGAAAFAHHRAVWSDPLRWHCSISCCHKQQLFLQHTVAADNRKPWNPVVHAWRDSAQNNVSGSFRHYQCLKNQNIMDRGFFLFPSLHRNMSTCLATSIYNCSTAARGTWKTVFG